MPHHPAIQPSVVLGLCTSMSLLRVVVGGGVGRVVMVNGARADNMQRDIDWDTMSWKEKKK